MPCHMWRWVSTKPGMTIMREASMTSALGALIFGRTAEILPPSISTSACSKSPTARSRLSTQPPLIRIGRPAATAPPGCCALAGPATVATIAEAAAAPAAVVQRNWRRDSGALHAPQEHDELPAKLRVMGSSRMLLLWGDASSLRAALPEMDARRAAPSRVAAHRGEVGHEKEKGAPATHAPLCGRIGGWYR